MEMNQIQKIKSYNGNELILKRKPTVENESSKDSYWN